MFGTQIALFFSHGDISHTYNPGAFVTEGAQKWLELVEIGRNTPGAIAMQLEGFVTSGCAEQIKETPKTKESKYFISITSDGT
jgi:hypothetical protein